MASFLAKSKTKSETSSSTLQVQFKEIPNEDVGQVNKGNNKITELRR